MYSVVNQFSLEEFKAFTNFGEIMRVILDTKCTEDILNLYIERNFKINVPNKDVWRAGGFASLRLTLAFYKSESAARIFRKVYGIKDCQVRLDRVNVSSDNQRDLDFLPSRATLDDFIFEQPLNVEGKKKKPTMLMKYPRKRKSSNVIELRTVDSEDIRVAKCPKNQLELSKRNNELIDHKRSDNVQPSPAPFTSIPIEIVARIMTASELRQHLRKTLYNHFKEVEIQFEKYMAETDVHCWLLKDFLDNYHKSTTATKLGAASDIERLTVYPESRLELTEMNPVKIEVDDDSLNGHQV